MSIQSYSSIENEFKNQKSLRGRAGLTQKDSECHPNDMLRVLAVCREEQKKAGTNRGEEEAQGGQKTLAWSLSRQMVCDR